VGELEERLPRAVFTERFTLLYAEAGEPSLTRVAESVARARRLDERGQPVRVSNQRISDWRRGRNVPARFSALAAVLEILIGLARSARPAPAAEGLYDLRAWQRLWKAALTSPTTAEEAPQDTDVAVSEVCPYQGLASFTHKDAAQFFGRERSTMVLLDRLADAAGTGGLVMLTGASGAGKSSLIRAGLTTEVARGALVLDGTTSSAMAVVVMTPGPEPLKELSRQVPVLTDALAGEDEAGLPAAVRAALTVGGRADAAEPRLLLVVDQFEEAFTLCADERQRRLFIEALAAACTPEHGAVPALVLLGVRADFYGQCLDHPELAQAMQDNQMVLGPMTEPELRQAISGPAKAAGLELETGLPDLLLQDLGASPHSPGRSGRGTYDAGALPLLSHALLATWQRRVSGTLTIAGYRAAGGIHGAVAATAEEAWSALTPDGRRVARTMLLRLVRVDRDGQDTRRRTARHELVDQLGDAASPALEVLVSARLVTLDADFVEITHEALLYAWPRLRKWIAEDRASMLVRQRLEDDAAEWIGHDRDASLLYRGARLSAAEHEGLAAEANSMTGTARDFVAVSMRHSRRSTWIRRAAVVVVALFAVIATASAVIASQQRDDAVFRQVVAEADRLQDTDPSLSAQLDLVAHQLRPDDRSVYARLIPTENVPLATPLLGHTGAVYLTSFSPDGTTLATASNDHTVRLWDVRDRTHPKALGPPLAGHTSWVSSAVFSPDGKTLATAGDDHVLILWNVADPAHPVQLGPPLAGGGGTIYLVAFSPDGRTLATANDDHTVRLWNLTDPAKAVPLGPPLAGHTDRVRSLALSPDGHTLAASGDDSTILLWNVTDPALPVRVGTPYTSGTGIVHTLAFSPDSRTLAAAGDDTAIRLWNVADPAGVSLIGAPLIGHTTSVWSVAFSPDGKELASAAPDGSARLWNLSDPAHAVQLGQPLEYRGRGSFAVSFSPDGDSIATGSSDGTTLLWTLPRTVLTGPGASISPAAFSPKTHLLVAVGADQTARLWDIRDPADPKPLPLAIAGHTDTIGSAAFTPDGRVLATASQDKTVRLWDVSDPASPRPLGQPLPDDIRFTDPVVISPDGHTLAAGADDEHVQLWNIDDPARPVRTGPPLTSHGYASAVAFSPDSRTLATTGNDQTVRLWDVSDPRAPRALGRPLTGYAGAVNALAFSPDGRTLASGADDAMIHLWDVTDPAHPVRQGAPLTGHTSPIISVAFSPDGHTLVSSSNDTNIRLWDLRTRTGQEFIGQSVSGHTSGAKLSPDGAVIATTSDDNAVRLWDLSEDNAARHICSATEGTLTPEQWQAHIPQVPYKPPCG
jgi:WD40 repeat protein